MSTTTDAQVATPTITRTEIARCIAADIPEGWNVNLGIGLPVLVADFVPPGREVLFHAENGILGMGPALSEGDHWLINAGVQHCSILPGGALFDQTLSFAMIRGGHLDLCVLGAFEVSQGGDLANWTTSATDTAPAVGGAMDLAVGAKEVWVAMEHATKAGASRLVESCTYPLTAARCVTRIYTNLAVLDVTPAGFKVRRLHPGVTFDALQAKTGAKIIIPSEHA